MEAHNVEMEALLQESRFAADCICVGNSKVKVGMRGGYLIFRRILCFRKTVSLTGILREARFLPGRWRVGCCGRFGFEFQG